jgi:hypothetical protein
MGSFRDSAASHTDEKGFPQPLSGDSIQVDRIECGNEMYDSTRPDVVAAYPSGRNYTDKMSLWAAAFKAAYPASEVALLAMTWRPDIGGREASWNDAVFNVPPELLAHIDAATLHPYFGIRWSDAQPPKKSGDCGEQRTGANGPWIATETGCGDACSCAQRCSDRAECRAWQWMSAPPHDCYLKSTAGMSTNDGSVSGIAPQPGPPQPPSPDAVADVFAAAFKFADENAVMVGKLPPKLNLWVTELAAWVPPRTSRAPCRVSANAARIRGFSCCDYVGSLNCDVHCPCTLLTHTPYTWRAQVRRRGIEFHVA